MNFDYHSYLKLIKIIKKYNYSIVNYHNYNKYSQCVILRHDIDTSLSKAVKMARLEADAGVSSTYFVLLTSDLYNVASKSSREALLEIQSLGHEIGLHFDEVAYGGISTEECINKILHEKDVLSSLLGTEITTVSMHRPSKNTLESDMKIPGMVNSYGQIFFKNFKYLSGSRRHWREPVEEIIKSCEFKRLHILTHAFWYNDEEISMHDSLKKFITIANKDRYSILNENITSLGEVLGKAEI